MCAQTLLRYTATNQPMTDVTVLDTLCVYTLETVLHWSQTQMCVL